MKTKNQEHLCKDSWDGTEPGNSVMHNDLGIFHQKPDLSHAPKAKLSSLFLSICDSGYTTFSKFLLFLLRKVSSMIFVMHMKAYS